MAIEIKCNQEGFVLLDINKVVPNPNNPNKHSDAQIARIGVLLEAQGFRCPLLISKRSGFLVTGEGRWAAAKKKEMTHVPVMYQDFASEAEEYAHMVADNAIAQWSKMDLAQINNDFVLLGPDLDVDLLGIDGFKIEPIECQLPTLNTTEPDCRQVTFVLSNEQNDLLVEALAKAQKEEDCSDEINKNKNGNILTAIMRRYVHG